jgi:hypothetical protein
MDENVINQQLTDHEMRLRKLEQTTTEMKYELANIKNELKDLKLLMMDFNKNQTELLNKFVNNTLDIKSNNNGRLWDYIFKVSVGIGVVINGIVTFYLK